MKKVFTLIALALVTMGAWAETKTISPSAETSFRTAGKEGDVETAPTAWQSGYPKTDQEKLECTYSQRMWAQQMYDVTDVDFDNALKVSLNFTMLGGKAYRLGAWIYPDANWTEASEQEWTDDKCPIVEKFKQVIGVYPSFIADANNYLSRYEGTSNADVQNIDFATTDKLQALKNAIVVKNGRKYINFIITFSEPKASWSKTRNPSFAGTGNATASSRPVMTIELPEPVAAMDYWTLTDSWKSTRTNGAVTVSGDALEITSGSDNLKRGDIKNTAETFRLDANKVVFYEIACTATGVTTNAKDRKLTFKVNVGSCDYIVEQFMYQGTETLSNGHELVYFDLSNLEKYPGTIMYKDAISSDNKLDTDAKTAAGSEIAALAATSLTNVGFTLIGTGDTNFTIYKMGSAKDVDTMKSAYGLPTGINGVNAAEQDDAPAYDLRGVRTNSTKGLIIKGGKKIVR
ncbi:MAG: hypothetical protein ACI4B3_09115 [Prevotella sp.]